MRARVTFAGLAVVLAITAPAGCGDDESETTSPSSTETTTSQPALCPEAGGANALNIGTLVGKAVDAASAAAEDHGCELRVVQEDGEDLAVTLDFNPDRINVAVEEGTITKIVSLG